MLEALIQRNKRIETVVRQPKQFIVAQRQPIGLRYRGDFVLGKCALETRVHTLI